MVSFVGKYQNLLVVWCIFPLALTISEILTFQIFDIKKLGQGQEVQFLQLHNSTANIKIYKCILHSFCGSSYRLRSMGELGTRRDLFKMAANLHILDNLK